MFRPLSRQPRHPASPMQVSLAADVALADSPTTTAIAGPLVAPRWLSAVARIHPDTIGVAILVILTLVATRDLWFGGTTVGWD